MNDEFTEYEEFKGVSDTIRKTMLGMLGYSAFCVAVLLQPDKLLFETNRIKLPFANVDVELFPFLYLGGMFLVAIIVYLHIFVHRWSVLAKEQNWTTPATIFNLPGEIPRLVSISLLFFLPLLLLALFCWKVLPHSHGHWSLALLYIISGILIYIGVRNKHFGARFKANTIVYSLIIVLLLLVVDLFTTKYFQLLRSVDLRGANLSGRDISGFNLSYALLEDANLDRSNLKYTNLFKADLRGASLVGADLEGANLDDANLAGTNLSFSFLGGSSMIGSFLLNTNLVGVALGNANLSGAFLNDAIMVGARLPFTNLSEATLISVDLKGTYLAGTNFSNATIESTDIRGAQFFPDPQKADVHTKAIISNTNMKNLICGIFSKELLASVSPLITSQIADKPQSIWLEGGSLYKVIRRELTAITGKDFKLPELVKDQCIYNDVIEDRN